MFDDGDDEDESLIRSILERRNFSFAPTRRESRDRGFGRDRSNRNASKGRKHDGTTSSGNHDNRHQKAEEKEDAEEPEQPDLPTALAHLQAAAVPGDGGDTVELDRV
ncbi:hypothetical protein THAOC_06482 [Thalassiosira oceanica]|uniref:Uncharacterized protein n=1 Tax=Thalassiosira oceanica TaxID=159749 RepID=K0TLP4_THAOC|nr:hypothetical protein THAOC_06482 [Thalassiosira oceanica]|eukprot:EJK72027.1 hypothetical protein THAOC_06482 [Thalassiosira oceanica]